MKQINSVKKRRLKEVTVIDRTLASVGPDFVRCVRLVGMKEAWV